jgi:hypothetical protein
MKYDKFDLHTYSYLELRKAIGWIGILLPFILMFGVFWLFKGALINESISHFYHTEMRNVFVGAMCAVGLFMFFYCGYDQVDNWAGNLAGLCAIGLAWFPTTDSGPSDWIGITHFTFAATFFLVLAFFSLFLFTKGAPIPTKRKLIRNKVYRLCGAIIVLCLLAIAIYFKLIPEPGPNASFVFWAETAALIAFGVSWLTKGGTLLPDKQ